MTRWGSVGWSTATRAVAVTIGIGLGVAKPCPILGNTVIASPNIIWGILQRQIRGVISIRIGALAWDRTQGITWHAIALHTVSAEDVVNGVVQANARLTIVETRIVDDSVAMTTAHRNPRTLAAAVDDIALEQTTGGRFQTNAGTTGMGNVVAHCDGSGHALKIDAASTRTRCPLDNRIANRIEAIACKPSPRDWCHTIFGLHFNAGVAGVLDGKVDNCDIIGLDGKAWCPLGTAGQNGFSRWIANSTNHPTFDPPAALAPSYPV